MKIYANRKPKVLCNVNYQGRGWNEYLVKLISTEGVPPREWYTCKFLETYEVYMENTSKYTEYQIRRRLVRNVCLYEDEIHLSYPLQVYTEEELFGEEAV